MEITKEKLISLISENYISDLEELEKHRERGPESVKKRQKIMKDGLHIGWMWRENMDDPNSKLISVYFLCGEDIEQFKEQHSEKIEEISSKYTPNGWFFSEEACPAHRPEVKKRIYKDPTGQEVDPFKTYGYKQQDVYLVIVDGEVIYQHELEDSANEFASEYRDENPGSSVVVKFGKRTKLAQENIKRNFNKILKEVFDPNSDFIKELNLRSIPPIIVDNPKFLDRHIDRWTNDKIMFRSLSYNTYPSAKEFLNAVVKRTRGTSTDELNTVYLSRQFNKKYKNWEEARKSDITYKGKTDDPDYEPPYQRRTSYKLDIQGYEELNMDVSLKMIFELIGEKMGDAGFVWTVKMVNKFGKKRPDEQVIVGGLQPIELLEGGVLDGRAIIATKTIQLPPNTKFDNNNTILNNDAIIKGLIEVLEDFKNRVKAIRPKDMIKYANVRRSDIERVNESKINDIIRSTLFEIKK
jgi:hypothetical protein